MVGAVDVDTRFLQEEQCWQTDGVTEVNYDETTRKLSFQTSKLKTLAVLQVSAKIW
jgi:hypothetical protein